MRPGNLKAVFFISLFVLNFYDLNSQEKVNLQDLQPSFEEESEIQGSENNVETSKIKSKKEKSIDTNETVVKLRALDKITAKTSDINIVIGNKKRFGYLEILPKRCARSKENKGDGVTAYLQVKDLSDKKDDKVFVFNGWTFSSSTTLKTFDHPVYDLWLTGCENI
tara:strand:+ start:4855 stop:5352 length:498 start_codon:yes stop_codon:yes gene_type:complete